MFQLPVAILAVLVQLILAFLYIVALYNVCCVTPDYGSTYADTTIKMSTSEQETMLSTALDFPTGKRVIDHCSILVPDAVGFSQELLPP